MRIGDITGHTTRIGGLDAINILSFVLSMKKEEVLTHGDMEIGEETFERIENLFRERAKGKPLAYITGAKEFYSQTFFVDRRVLIPRPETELIVEEALAILRRMTNQASILDVGTGAGIIGNIIAHATGKDVVCTDISRDALCVAEKNGRNAGISGRLKFVCSDLFTGIKPGKKFGLIAANLPYVADGEWDSLMIDVKEYEPRPALIGGEDGLDIYRRFTADLLAYLSEDGYVLCEIGGTQQAEEMVRMFRSIGLTSMVKRDLAQKERVIIGSWTSLS